MKIKNNIVKIYKLTLKITISQFLIKVYKDYKKIKIC